MEKKILILFFLTFFFYGGHGDAAELEAGKGRSFATISAALEAAQEGDTILVYPGQYKEKLEIDKSIILKSVKKHQAVIIGNNQKHVITIKSPNVVIQGFKIKESGEDFLKNDAGILVDKANHAEILDNHFTDVLFGIYLDSSDQHVIKNNQIEGLKGKRLSERGNGIHFYNTKNNEVDRNKIENVRDGMYFDHADETIVTNNQISHVRYGLHYMWSNHNTFRNNYFSENVSGAAIMFSKFINLDHNVFMNNRGHRAFGIFFQTAEESVVKNNLFINNSIGIYSDLSRGNTIRNNTMMQNDIGMEMLGSNWDNKIYQNDFIENLQQVSVNELNIQDQWSKDNKGNYWSDYAGIDMWKDGVGDKEYHSGSSFDYLMYKYPHFRLFIESPTAKMLQMVDQMFPVLERAEIVDPYPLMKRENGEKDWEDMYSNKSKQAGVITFLLSISLTLLSVAMIRRIKKRFNQNQN